MYLEVHRLVAQAFLGPPPDDSYEVDHKDRNRKNNDISNLQWVTHKENIERIPYEVGSSARKNSNNGRAVLNEESVSEIRYFYKNNGMSIAELSKMYGVGWSTIYNIVKYKTWKDID